MSNPALSESFPNRLTQAQLDTLFPLGRAPIAPKSYEIGLVLSGTVSAGAYTAGVLDYILEALDAWTLAKQSNDPQAPRHDAVLSTIAGASGGAINGAILTRVAGFGFPHGAVSGNPLYDVWVNGVDLADLLAPDAPSNGLSALFNTTKFAQIATHLVTEPGPALGQDGKTPAARSFLADPLRLFVMVANVTGIPYSISFQGATGLGHSLVDHADYVRFGLTVPQGIPNAPTNRPDEFALATPSTLNWDLLSQAALCTSAFPAAFPSRGLSRALAMLGYRVAVVPDDTDQNKAQIAQLVPSWNLLLENGKTPGQVRTTNVDGGTVNNQPLDFARTALAGMNGRNPRSGADAFRGVVMIDPFCDPPDLGPYDPPGFLKLLGPLVYTLVYQARFKPEDIALALDYDTYSRFLVAPKGPAGGVTDVLTSKAIASGGLGGFLGFVDRSFLDYDFCLGRRNAYEFLAGEFVLPEENDLFQGTWTEDQKAVARVFDRHPVTGAVETFLPIVPLMAALRNDPPPKPTAREWPRLSAVPGKIGDQVTARLNSIYAALKNDLQKDDAWPGGIAGFGIDSAWSLFLRNMTADKFVAIVDQALNDQNLLPTLKQTFPRTSAGQAAAQTAQKEWLAAGARSSTLNEDGGQWVLTTEWG